MGKGLPEARPQLTCDPKVVFISFRHSFAHPPRATCIPGPEDKLLILWGQFYSHQKIKQTHCIVFGKSPRFLMDTPPFCRETQRVSRRSLRSLPREQRRPLPPRRGGCLALRCPASLQVPLTRIRTGRAGAGAFTAPTGAQRAEHCLLNGQGAFGNLHDAALKTSVCRTCQGHTLQPWKWL